MKKLYLKHKKNILIIASLLLISAGITAYFINFSAESETPEEVDEGRLVEVEELSYSPFTLSIEGQGYIRSTRSIEILSRVSGKVDIPPGNLKSGTAVKTGEVLVRLDDQSIRNSFALARVQLIQATASLLSALKTDSADLVYQRWQEYLKSLNNDKTTIPPLPETKTEREMLLTSTYGILSAYYSAKDRETQLSYYTVRAPFDGYVVGDGVESGSFVAAGQVLLTLTDTVHLEVSVPLTRDQMLLLDEKNKNAVIRPAGLPEKQSLSAERVRQDAVMDRNTQTMNVHLRFDNPEAYPLLLPGNYAEIELQGKTLDRAFRIPRALINSDGTVNVYDQGKLVFLPVEAAAVQGDSVILKPTLPEGTGIVLTRLQKPFQGMALKKEETLP